MMKSKFLSLLFMALLPVSAFASSGGTPVGPGTAQYFANGRFTCNESSSGAKLVREDADKIEGFNSSSIKTREYRIESTTSDDQKVSLSGHGFYISSGPVADTGCSGELKWSLTIENTDGSGQSNAVLHLDRTDSCPGWNAPRTQSGDFNLSCKLQ